MLFSPGPIMVKDNVREEMMHYDICHRGAEFEALFADTVAKVNKLFKADDSYQSVLISGSGTSSNETVLSSIFNEGEKVMLIRNGVFGERLLEIIEKYEIAAAAVAEKAIPRCSIVWLAGEEYQTVLKNFLSVLFEANPASIGGNMPGEDFYN